jgi:hypothetical protein
VLSGTPERAGIYEVSVTATNQWGSTTGTFDLEVLAIPPQSQTADATQIGSTSARLQANILDLGGMDGNLSFIWSRHANLSVSAETDTIQVANTGFSSALLTGLAPSTTYYYQAKLANSAGVSLGDSISVTPDHFWDLNDSGLTALDQAGNINGVINGASTTLDTSKGNVLSFDGDNDYVNLRDVEEMDQADRFTISLWFKRSADSSTEATANGIDNVLIAQSSDSSNDNLEIGTQGSEIEIYVDSGTASTDQTVRVEAGITNDVWYHLALVYGSEMSVYLDGTKVSTWTQYNGRLESSGSSPLSIGSARPDRGNPWGDFSGEMHRVELFYEALSSAEIELLAGLGSVKSFTTGSQAVPPIVVTRPATNITDSNATISYELVSYDGAQPEIILYWGSFDHQQNAGLWDFSQSMGTQPAGSGSLDISGFESGQTIFYQVQAKGGSYSDWSDKSGQFRTVSSPTVVSATAVNQTTSSAVLRGEILSNGGESILVQLPVPLVSKELIAHWRFDEGQGSEAYDSTGFSSVGQVYGGATWTEGLGGQYGTALKFDGGGQAYVEVGDFTIEGATSFSVWAYKENLGNWQRVFDFGDGPNSHNLMLANRWTTNEAEWSIRRGPTNRTLVVQDFWTLNEWQHVVASVDDSGLMKLYRNGVLRGAFLRNGHLPEAISRTKQYVGKSNWGNHLLGMIDDLRVYDRAISLDEVEQIYGGDLQQYLVLGGEDPTVTLFWGDEDAGTVTDIDPSASGWDQSQQLGARTLGEFEFPLSGLTSGKVFYYRILAENSAGISWSEVSTFSTGDFEFGTDSVAGGDMLLWLDSSDIDADGNASNEPYGGNVDFWRDKSGGNRHAGNGNGPSLQINRWNNLTTLKFDGNSQYLRVNDSDVFDFGEDGTIFIVAQGHNTGTWRPIVSKRGGSGMGWQFRTG